MHDLYGELIEKKRRSSLAFVKMPSKRKGFTVWQVSAPGFGTRTFESNLKCLHTLHACFAAEGQSVSVASFVKVGAKAPDQSAREQLHHAHERLALWCPYFAKAIEFHVSRDGFMSYDGPLIRTASVDGPEKSLQSLDVVRPG